METLGSPEKEREAVIFEAEQLAKSHNMELSELAGIINEKLAEGDEVNADDTENEEGRLKERLRVRVGQLFENFAFQGLAGDTPENAESEIIETLNELGYSPGSTVTVERSNGDLEEDWEIQEINANSGIVKVSKEDDGEILTKNVQIQNFLEKNLGITYSHP